MPIDAGGIGQDAELLVRIRSDDQLLKCPRKGIVKIHIVHLRGLRKVLRGAAFLNGEDVEHHPHEGQQAQQRNHDHER